MREQFRLERLKRRISQWTLAQATGIGQSRISLFENGFVKLRPEELGSIRRALGLTQAADKDEVERV